MPSQTRRDDRDFYALLGVERTASPDAIQRAYRQSGLMFHPDKQTDARLRQSALVTFQQIKKAYEVLSDPDKRAVYDVLGHEGLSAHDVEIVAREKSIFQILTEYKLSRIDKEDEQFAVLSNHRGNYTIGLDVSDFGSTEYLHESVSLDSATAHSSSDFQLDDRTVFSILHLVECDPNLRASCSVGGSVRRKLTDKGSDVVTGTVMVGTSPRINVHLTSYSFGLPISAQLNLLLHNGGLLPQLQVDTRYDISRNVASELSLGPLPTSPFLMSAISYTGERFFSRLSAKFSPQHKIKFGIQTGLTWNPFKFSASLGCRLNEGLSLSVFAEQSLTRWTGVSTQVRVSANSLTLDCRLSRGPFVYCVPIIFARDIPTGGPVLYSTLAVLAIHYMSKWVCNRYANPPGLETLGSDASPSSLPESRRLALDQQVLLMTSCERTKGLEGPDGLLIVRAIYGNVSSENEQRRLDVRIPLQAMVANGKLHISSGSSKADLIGFYNPNPESTSDNQLLLNYYWKRQAYELMLNDSDALLIP